MEIKIKIPKYGMVRQRVSIDEELFEKKLVEFVSKYENDEYLDEELYDELVAMGINQSEFDKMIARIEVWASYDDDKETIGFPYENWTDRLLGFYTNARK